MADEILTISKIVNGYEIEYEDPEIIAANRKRDMSSKMMSPWKDPTKEMAFKTVQEVIDFLKDNLEKLEPDDDYNTSFAKAVMENDDE